MSFLSELGKKFKSKSKEFFDKREQERKEEEALRRQQATYDKIAFEKAFRESGQKAAKIRAQREAGERTGLRKLRAIGRVEDLGQENRKEFLPKLSEFMNRNLKKREENLRKTAVLRAEAEKMKQQRTNNPQNTNLKEVARYRKPFSDLKSGLVKY